MNNSSQQYQIKQQCIKKYFLELCHPSTTKKDFAEAFKTFKQEQQDSSIQLSIDDGYQLSDENHTETNLLNEAIKRVLLSEVKGKQKFKTALALLDFIVDYKPNIHKKLNDDHDYNSMTGLFAIMCSNNKLFFSNNKKLKTIYNKIKQINKTTNNQGLLPSQFKYDLLFYEKNNGFNINYSLVLFDIYKSTNTQDKAYQKQITNILVDYYNQHLNNFINQIQDCLTNNNANINNYINNEQTNDEPMDIVSLNSRFIPKGAVNELHETQYSFYYLSQKNNETSQDTQQRIIDFYIHNIYKNQLLKQFQLQYNIRFVTQDNNRFFKTLLNLFQNGVHFNSKQQEQLQSLIQQEKQSITKQNPNTHEQRKMVTLNQLDNCMLYSQFKNSGSDNTAIHSPSQQLSNKRKLL